MNRSPNPRDILVRPVISEKSLRLADDGKYTFIVAPGSHKNPVDRPSVLAAAGFSCVAVLAAVFGFAYSRRQRLRASQADLADRADRFPDRRGRLPDRRDRLPDRPDRSDRSDRSARNRF